MEDSGAGEAENEERKQGTGRRGGRASGRKDGKDREMGKESGEQSFRFHGDPQLQVHADKAPEDATHRPRQGAQRASFSGSGRPRGTGAGSCLGSCHICKSPPQATPDGTGVTATPPPSRTWSSARGAARRCPLEARAVCTVYAHREGSPLPPGLRLNVKAALAKVSRGRHVAKHDCLLHLTLHVILLERPSPAPNLSMQSRPHPLVRMLATCLPLSWSFMCRSCFSGSSPRVTPPFLAGLQLSEDRDCPTHCHWVSESVRSRHPIRIILKAKQKEDSQRQGQCPPNVPLPVLEAGRWRAPPALEFHCGRLESSSKAPS